MVKLEEHEDRTSTKNEESSQKARISVISSPGYSTAPVDMPLQPAVKRAILKRLVIHLSL